MSFSVEQQAIADFITGSLPKWFWGAPRTQEDLAAMVAGYDAARQQVDHLFRQGLITESDGPIGDEPDWLNQHAIDRATHRQAGESDDALRLRLRTFTDALTVPVLMALMQAMLDTEGVPGDPTLVELRRDRAFFTTRQRIQGTASGSDAFTKVGTTMTLHLAGVTFQGGMLLWGRPSEPVTVTIAGATSGANNGAFVVTGFDGESIQYTNASGVAEVYGGTWTIGAKHHGRKGAYLDRGYRMGLRRPGLIAILPYGTTEDLRLAIHEALRQRKAAGVGLVTEARVVP